MIRFVNKNDSEPLWDSISKLDTAYWSESIADLGLRIAEY